MKKVSAEKTLEIQKRLERKYLEKKAAERAREEVIRKSIIRCMIRFYMHRNKKE